MPEPMREVVQYKGHEVIGVAIPARGQFLWETRIAGWDDKGVRHELPLMARDRFFATVEEAIAAALAEGRKWLDARSQPIKW